MTDDSRTFRARALAQAHPLSAGAHRYVNSMVARERLSQPQPEIGTWAGYALTAGYCLRRVEEVEVLGHVPESRIEDPAILDRRAVSIAAQIRTSGAEGHYLIDEDELVAELDGLIGSEIERRLDDWRDTVTPEVWSELEDYIAWWTIKGYALRIAETAPDGER
jgi:hypothetical protein